jgi:hypothetical protein
MEDTTSQRNHPLQKSPVLFCDSRVAAVKDFARHSLSNVPAEWVAGVLRARGLPTAMPMCAMLFMIDEQWLADNVRKHITNFHFGEDVDRQRLVDSGWRVIPKTGLFAFELDGFLLLGIDGIGYDFFDAHWRPLYELLELGWHLDD